MKKKSFVKAPGAEHMDPIRIFAGSTGQDFARGICEYLNIPLGKSSVLRFSDGNLFVKAEETVREKDVFLIQSIGMDPNAEFTEILFWMDAFKRASARTVTAVLPYFGYAKGDKKDEPRVSIRARVCADAIERAGADRIITLDLHSPQIQGFFSKPVDHLYARPVLVDQIKSLGLHNAVIVSPDAGFMKQARKFAEDLGMPLAVGDKVRRGHDESARVLEIIGEVKGKIALVVDDFSISGGTLVDVAKGLVERGAKEVWAVLSHFLLREKGVQKIIDSPIKRIIGTDTVYNPFIIGQEKFKIYSVAPLVAETIKRIHFGRSVSPLFDQIDGLVGREKQ
jgi:ribose-phosphate pyrophosphokinase